MKMLSRLILLPLLWSCQNGQTGGGTQTPREPRWNLDIQKFSNCGEIADYWKAYEGQTGDPLPMYAAEGSVEQVDGVREGDILQQSATHFFFARSGSIEVIRKKDLAWERTLPTPLSYRYWILYVDRKLVFVGNDQSQTRIQIFDENKNFAKVHEQTLIGTSLEFRHFKDQLYLVTQAWELDLSNPNACSQIYRPNWEDGSKAITYLQILNLNSYAHEATGFMGSTGFFYLDETELLLFQNQGSVSFMNDFSQSTYFRKVLIQGGVQLKQIQAYEGSVKDRWSVTKKNRHLILATTLLDGQQRNKLISYQMNAENLYSKVFETGSFGVTENIRSVRYVGDKAYVVTFQQTDPLFIFDIQNPAKIQLLSHLEVPGFSTQLRELESNYLMGFGFQVTQQQNFTVTSGLQFSLFDVSQAISPKVLQQIEWGDRGSYSEATFEPKALFVSASQGRVIFPAVLFRNGFNLNSPGGLEFAGAIVLSIEGSLAFELGRITHRPWREEKCGTQFWRGSGGSVDIQRVVQADGQIYTFSRFGVIQSSAQSLQPKIKTPFSNPHCSEYSMW